MKWFIFLCAAVFVKNVTAQDQVWELHSAVINLPVGPELAAHCRLTSPTGELVFDGFGPCRVNIPRVTHRHTGVWVMSVHQLTTSFPDSQTFTVRLAGTGYKSAVTTTVEEEDPVVDMMCSVQSSELLVGCVYLDPRGTVVHVRSGVTDGRHTFTLTSASGVLSCGVSINGIIPSDVGMWRCDIQTSSATYYGHLRVLPAWAVEENELAEYAPTLTTQNSEQTTVEGDSVAMSCSIHSAIRYCYFTAENGTVYNVRPGMTPSYFNYVGNGLDAGECGIRFLALQTSDSGSWSCHVGLQDTTVSIDSELSAEFSIEVQETMSASLELQGIVRRMVVHGQVARLAPLDYCRFVRHHDGIGFTSENMPDGYSDVSSVSRGSCEMYIAAPVTPNDYAWTVVAKVTGLNEELARYVEIYVEPPYDHQSLWWLYAFVIPGVLVLILLVGICIRRSCSKANTVTA